MLDGLHRISGFLDLPSNAEREPAGLTQAAINALPSIMGLVDDPDSDHTARVDRAGYVYLWEPGEGTGFWVQAGYARNNRLRIGQAIDPRDIRWFDLAVFKKKVLHAKKSLNAVRLPSDDDLWDVGREAERLEARAQHQAGIGENIGNAFHASHDPDDIDII